MINENINKLTITDQISFLQRWILLNSIIYYDLNDNLVTDFTYDEYAKYLEKLMNENQIEAKESQYYYVFYNYTSVTGFDLKSKLNKKDNEYLTQLSKYILYNKKSEIPILKNKKGKNK